MSTRMTKEDFPVSFGVFKPVDHVVVSVKDDGAAEEMKRALLERGFSEQDVLCYRSDEMSEQIKTHLPHISGASGFGTEVQFMRHYDQLAAEGHGWVIAYAPDEAQEQVVTEVAEEFNADLAHKYHRLVTEELIQHH